MAVNTRSILRFLIFSLPFAVLFGGYINLCKIPSVGYLDLERLVFLLILALGIIETAFRGRFTLHLGKAAPMAGVFALLLVYATFSLSWADDFRKCFDAYLYILFGVGTLLFLTAAVRGFHDLTVLLRVITAAYIVILAFGFFEIFTGTYLLSQNPIADQYKNGYNLYFPYGPFYNMNDYASCVTLFLPFACVQTAADLKGAKGKLAALILALAGLFTVLNASARLCYAAAAVFAAAFLVAAAGKRELHRSFKPAAAAALALLVVLALLIASGALQTSVFTGEVASAGERSNSSEMRAQMLQAGLQMLPDSFFLGVGVGGSVALVPAYTSLSAINLHDMLLTIAAEYGAAFLILFLAVILFLAAGFFRTRGFGSRKRAVLSCLCFGSVLSFLPVSFASSDCMHVLPLWVVMAVWLIVYRLLNEPEHFSEGGSALAEAAARHLY